MQNNLDLVKDILSKDEEAVKLLVELVRIVKEKRSATITTKVTAGKIACVKSEIIL